MHTFFQIKKCSVLNEFSFRHVLNLWDKVWNSTHSKKKFTNWSDAAQSLFNILKDKSSAPSKVKIHIKSSSGWIIFKFSHKMTLYVYNDRTKFRVLVINNFVLNRHNITHSCIFRFPVPKLMFACGFYGYPIRRSVGLYVLASM